MKDDSVLKQLKELLEIIKHKVDNLEFFQDSMSSNIKRIKEQQSVMNEKLDSHSGSLVNIESKLDAYGDMYKQSLR